MENFLRRINLSTLALWGAVGLATVGVDLSPSPAFADAPPNPVPNYFDQRASAKVDHVEVQRAFDSSSGKIVMQIIYRDAPQSPFVTDEPLSVWVRLNGAEGIFPLRRARPEVMGEESGRAANLSNEQYNCDPASSRGSDCSDPSVSMDHLFVWAKRSAPNQPKGRLNAWDVELAFVNARGVWDNHNGQNFKFRFDEPALPSP
jgi:hypothetical protein